MENLKDKDVIEGKPRKAMVKKIAKIYAGCVVINTMGAGASSDYLTEEETELLHEEMSKIAMRISGSSDIIGIGELDQIILSVTQTKQQQQ